MTALTSPPLPASPLVSLQVLRAVAASMVVLHHAGFDADRMAARAGGPPLGLDRVVDLGFGVHLFFVISGFIMLRSARGFGSVRGALVFMARRAVRVVPLYWLLTSLTLLGAAAAPSLLNGPIGGIAWVAGSYLFVPVARPGGAINPVLGQGWTLDYEMFFYLLFAAAMTLPRPVALAALALSLVGLVALGQAVAPPFAAAAVWTDGLLLEFLMGLGLALAAERGLRRGRRLGGPGAALLVLAGAAGAVAMGPLSGRFDGLAPWLREGVPAALVVGGCVLGPRWAAGRDVGGRPRGPARAVLPRRAVLALARLGDASYSLYLSHPFAVRLVGVAWAAAAPGLVRPLPYVAAAVAAAMALALALHRLVERPMTEALQRRTAAGLIARPVLPEVGSAPRR